MGKRSYALIMLLCMFAVNANIFCGSLCASGGHTAGEIAHHVHGEDSSTSEKAICPLSHGSKKDLLKVSENQDTASVKCDCTGDSELSSGYAFIFPGRIRLTPCKSVVSIVQHERIKVLSVETFPLEYPPKPYV